jgi:hypothetical protein
MIADVPRTKLSELTARLGDGLGEDTYRCEALLTEACGDGFGEECAALVAAIEHRITGDLLRGRHSSETPGALIERLRDRLEADAGLSSYRARWSVECWALALGVVPESDRLMIRRIEGLVPLIESAGTNGALGPDDLDRLVAEAMTRGIGDGEARAYLSHYAARRSWRLPDASSAEPDQLPSAAEPSIAQIPPPAPTIESALPLPSPVTPAELGDPRPSAPARRPRLRLAALSAAGLVLLAVAGLIATAPERHRGTSEALIDTRPEATQPDRQRIEAGRQRQPETERQQQQEAERERQAEAERQRQAEAERQRQAEAEHQRQAEAEHQRQAEAERQRQAEAERQRQQATIPKPDIKGIVTGAQSASRIVLDKQVIELFGIVDPTINLRSHVDLILRYLAPSQRQVECFTRPGGKFQCFADGKDLALQALRDGIAQLGPDAPIEYRRR